MQQSTEPDQPPTEDPISPADELAVHLLFKRIAERGRRIRKEREAAEQRAAEEETQDEH